MTNNFIQQMPLLLPQFCKTTTDAHFQPDSIGYKILKLYYDGIRQEKLYKAKLKADALYTRPLATINVHVV